MENMATAVHPSHRSAGSTRKKRASVVLCGVSGDVMTGGNLWLISPEDVSYLASVNPEAQPDISQTWLTVIDLSRTIQLLPRIGWDIRQIAFFFEGGVMFGDVCGRQGLQNPSKGQWTISER